MSVILPTQYEFLTSQEEIAYNTPITADQLLILCEQTNYTWATAGLRTALNIAPAYPITTDSSTYVQIAESPFTFSDDARRAKGLTLYVSGGNDGAVSWEILSSDGSTSYELNATDLVAGIDQTVQIDGSVFLSNDVLIRLSIKAYSGAWTLYGIQVCERPLSAL